MSRAPVDLVRNIKSAMVKANKFKGTNVGPFIFYFVVLTYSSIAMRPAAIPDHLKMAPINSLQEADLMTHKIVAFITISGRFNWVYPLSNVRCLFGVMLEAYSSGQKFYYIKQVIPVETPDSAPYYMDDQSLKEAKLKMRLAIQEEIIALHETIHLKQNKFVGFAFLEQQAGYELQKKKIA